MIRTRSNLVDRADILSFLLAQFLAGADKPTLYQMAVWAQVDQDFIQETNRLDNQRTMYLDTSH